MMCIERISLRIASVMIVIARESVWEHQGDTTGPTPAMSEFIAQESLSVHRHPHTLTKSITFAVDPSRRRRLQTHPSSRVAVPSAPDFVPGFDLLSRVAVVQGFSTFHWEMARALYDLERGLVHLVECGLVQSCSTAKWSLPLLKRTVA